VRVRLGDDSQRNGPGNATVRDGQRLARASATGTYRALSLKSELAGVDAEAAGSLTAPMPGRIVKVMTKPGCEGRQGATRCSSWKAMKMEHTITAPAEGTVKTVHYAAGEQVLEGAELVTLE
jgi:3-methylcrotonyl-CoA carboxylase alpha subunit